MKNFIRLLFYHFIEDYISFVITEDYDIYCGIGTEEEILNNIETFSKDYEYREFSKKELESLMDHTYIFDLSATKELMNFINDNFDIPQEEVKQFISMVVENYIDLLEENNSDAEEILIKMIEENFELDKSLKTSFINLIEEVYNQYPKAKYKGYAQEQE